MDGAETAAAVIAARELGAETVVAGLPLCVGYERELWMLASAAAAAVGCGCELGGTGTALRELWMVLGLLLLRSVYASLGLGPSL